MNKQGEADTKARNEAGQKAVDDENTKAKADADKENTKRQADYDKAVADREGVIASNTEKEEKHKADQKAYESAQADYEKAEKAYQDALKAKEQAEATNTTNDADYARKQAEYNEAKKAYDVAKAEYDQAVKAKEQAEATNTANNADYARKQAEYNEAKKAYDLAKSEYDQAVKAKEQAIAGNTANQKDYEAKLAEYEKKKAVYDRKKAEYDQAVATHGASNTEYQRQLAEYEKKKQAYDVEKAEHDRALEDYKRAKDNLLREAERTVNSEGYLAEAHIQNLIYRSEPNARTTITGDVQFVDPAYAGPYFQNGTFPSVGEAKQGIVGSARFTHNSQYPLLSEQAMIVVPRGGTFKTVSEVHNTYFNGRKVARVENEYTLLRSEGAETLVAVFRDPTENIKFGSADTVYHATETRWRFTPRFFYEDGSQVNFSDGSTLVALGSMNAGGGAVYPGSVDYHEFTYIKDGVIEFIPINGSAITLTAGNKVRSDGSDIVAENEDASSPYYGWDKDKSPKAYRGAAVIKLTGTEPTVEFGANYDLYQWWTFNADLPVPVSDNLQPPTPPVPPTPPTKPTGNIPDEPVPPVKPEPPTGTVPNVPAKPTPPEAPTPPTPVDVPTVPAKPTPPEAPTPPTPVDVPTVPAKPTPPTPVTPPSLDDVPPMPTKPEFVTPVVKTFKPEVYVPVEPKVTPHVPVPNKENHKASVHPVEVKQKPTNVKDVVNEDGVSINGMLVPKGHLATWELTNTPLKAGRDQVTTYEMSDPLPSGFELDLSATEKANPDWIMATNETGGLSIFATPATLDLFNKDRSQDVAIPVFKLVGRPMNDGGTYENTFKTIVSTPKGNYTTTSNTPVIYTPGNDPKKPRPPRPEEPNTPPTPNDNLIQPKKDVVDENGVSINGKQVLPNTPINYVLTQDFDQYKGLVASKEAIGKGFIYVDDYLDEALDGKSMVVNSITAKNGDDVSSLLDMYHVLSKDTLDERLAELVKASGISPVGEFYLWVAKNPEDFFKAYVQKGLDVTYNLSFKIKEKFVGKITNQSFQIDFGNGYYGNIVENEVPELKVNKDVVIDGEAVDKGEVKLGDTVEYVLEGWVIPADRGYDIKEYRFVDILQSSHDEYQGFKVTAKVDITLADGTVIKKGTELSEYVVQTYDVETGTFELKFNDEFLSQIPRSSAFGSDVLLKAQRIQSGTVENEFTLYVNGIPVKSDKVITETPEPPKPPTPEVPEEPKKEVPPTPVTPPAPKEMPKRELPKTGDSSSVLGLVGTVLSSLGVVGLKRRKK